MQLSDILRDQLFTKLVILVFYFAYALLIHRRAKPRYIVLFYVIGGVILFKDLASWFLYQSPQSIYLDFAVSTVLILLYFQWTRLHTRRGPADIALYVVVAITVVLNLLAVFIAIPVQFLLNIALLFVSILILVFTQRSVNEFNCEVPQKIYKVKRVTIIYWFSYLVLFLISSQFAEIYDLFFVPLAMIFHFYMLHNEDLGHHEGILEKSRFLENDIDSLFDFMKTIGNAIANKLELNEILNFVVSSSVKNTNGDAGAILLVDEYDDVLTLRAVTGVFPPPFPIPDAVKRKISMMEDYFRSNPIKPGVTVLGEVLQSGEPLYVRSTTEDPRFVQNSKNDVQFINSLMVIPLVVAKRVLGVLAVVKRNKREFFSQLDYSHLKTFADYASLTIDNLITYMELLEKKEMEREVGIAAGIQNKLIPRKLPKVKNASLSAYSIPAKGVSGDYYDIIPLTQNKVVIVICDVAGKGVPASLVMVMIRSILHLVAGAGKTASAIMNWVNRGVCGNVDIDHFATMSLFLFDPDTKEISYSNAAHHPLFVYRAATKKVNNVDTEGLPIGIEQGTQYNQVKFRVQKGDILLQYTDGIIEAMNSSGEQYSYDRLSDVIKANCDDKPSDLISKIKQEIASFVGNAKQHDDQTLLVMKIE